MREIPVWAVLERRLFDEIERAWPRFPEKFCEPDGRLRYTGEFSSRDGADDFYEAFFNWPTFYALGGSDEILKAAKHHWRGVTEQLTEAGMLTGEYENGYDWFHQGESLIFLYALCAADPDDAELRERAARFARLYLDPSYGNYDPDRRIIRAPHNGAQGAREGLGSEWLSYSASQDGMKPYGLPLEGLPGIETWEDLADPDRARLMGDEMRRRARGDVVVNLAATSLVVNAWLYDGDSDAASWVEDYVGAWRERAEANGGLIPDNVGPNGSIGELQDGRWWGGHYGWNWPHGLHSVGMGALIGGMNAALVTGDDSFLDVTRNLLDAVIERGKTGTVAETPASLQASWLSRLGGDATRQALLVPYRYGTDGWFDYLPMPLELPMWLWWFSRDSRDLDRLRHLAVAQPESDTEVKPFRNKEEAGHELPWLSFLLGENPHYPERALSMALGQVARRAALVETQDPDPQTVHIHFWQRVQPVVTEVLGQLISGAPQVLYNGGLPLVAVSFDDVDQGRPGLPTDVGALVTRLDDNEIELELVNLSTRDAHTLRIWPGRFGERDIISVRSTGEEHPQFPGDPVAYTSVPDDVITMVTRVDAPYLPITLPPSHRAMLTLVVSEPRRAPRYRTSSPTTSTPEGTE